MSTQEFGGGVMMTISLKMSDLPKGVILERVTKKNQAQQMYYLWFISEQAI